MAKNTIKITEEDIAKMVRNAVRIIKEETQSTEKFWQASDGSAKAWEKVSVSTSDSNNTDPAADTEGWDSNSTNDILGKNISGGDSDSEGTSMNYGKHDMDNNYDNGDFDFSDDATDVKDDDNSKDGPKSDAKRDGNSGKSNGTQFNQGGDPFSQRIGDNPTANDNAATSKGEFSGWGDSLDNIVNDEVKKAINEMKRKNQ